VESSSKSQPNKQSKEKKTLKSKAEIGPRLPASGSDGYYG
jgi:hypothetical protein